LTLQIAADLRGYVDTLKKYPIHKRFTNSPHAPVTALLGTGWKVMRKN